MGVATPRGWRGLKRIPCRKRRKDVRRHPTRVAGIETQGTSGVRLVGVATPRGGWRGLKPIVRIMKRILISRHPTRVAWIETTAGGGQPGVRGRHPTRVAWIETKNAWGRIRASRVATPRGWRGLKPPVISPLKRKRSRHPTRVAWIETGRVRRADENTPSPPHAGGVD